MAEEGWGDKGRPIVGATGGPVRAGAYVRVFSAPLNPVRDRLSLEAQLSWCVEEVERRGWDLTETFTDVGVAVAADGPGFQLALEAAQEGTIDALVTASPGQIAPKQEELVQLALRLDPVLLVVGKELVRIP